MLDQLISNTWFCLLSEMMTSAARLSESVYTPIDEAVDGVYGLLIGVMCEWIYSFFNIDVGLVKGVSKYIFLPRICA